MKESGRRKEAKAPKYFLCFGLYEELRLLLHFVDQDSQT